MGNFKDLSDLDLLGKIDLHDSRALEELYDRYAPILFTLIKKITENSEDAGLILSEVFEILWKKSREIPAENCYAWLILLSRNKAVNHRRRASGLAESYDEAYQDEYIIPVLDRAMVPMDLSAAFKMKPAIKTALESLTEAQLYTIELAYYRGLRIDEISAKLNIPVETVRSKIRVALENLEEILTDNSPCVADEQLNQMICAFALGSMDEENYKYLKNHIESSDDLPEGELGRFQALVSLIPLCLETETPPRELKDSVGRKLMSLKSETKGDEPLQESLSNRKAAEMLLEEIEPARSKIVLQGNSRRHGNPGFFSRGDVFVIIPCLMLIIAYLCYERYQRVPAAESRTETRSAVVSGKEANAAEEFMSYGDLKILNFKGKILGRVQARLLLSFANESCLFLASGIPSPQENKEYRLWAMTSGGPLFILSLSPKKGERISLREKIPMDLKQDVKSFKLTEEAKSAPRMPEGETLLSTSL